MIMKAVPPECRFHIAPRETNLCDDPKLGFIGRVISGSGELRTRISLVFFDAFIHILNKSTVIWRVNREVSHFLYESFSSRYELNMGWFLET